MEYYERIRQRRTDLHLSIQDISIQTRLNADQLRAIEGNDLASLGDDTVYARLLIQAYCRILGIRWETISGDVDRALGQGRREIPSGRPVEAEKSQPERVLRKPFRFLAAPRGFGFLAVSAIAVLLLANYVIEQISLQDMKELEARQLVQASQREERTRQLADAMKARREAVAVRNEPQIEISEEGICTVSNVVADNGYLLFDFQLEEPGRIRIYEDGRLIFLDRSSDTSSFDLDVESPRTLSLEISPWSAADQITIGGEEVMLLSGEDEDLVLDIHIVSDPQNESQLEAEELQAGDFEPDQPEWEE